MATGPVLIDKLLTTVIQLKASDLHISVGQPPVIRHHSRLRRLDAKVLDSGCCGMAGGFGYEKDHYAVSIACGAP